MPETATTPNRSRRRGATFFAVGAAALALTAGVASAREIGSGTGGGGGGTTACNPVSSLTAKGDPRVGELGFAAIDVTYSVKSCDGGPVAVHTTVAEWADPSQVVWDNPAALANDKFRVNGVKVRTTYKVTVEVTDAVTGAAEGTSSVFVAAIPKGV